MALGIVVHAVKEAAKKTIKEAAKQVTNEAKKGTLKDRLEKAVKEEVKGEIKDRVKEDIDDNLMDVRYLNRATSSLKASRDGLSEIKEKTDKTDKKSNEAGQTEGPSLRKTLNETVENKKETSEQETDKNDTTNDKDTDNTDESITENYKPNSYVTIDGTRYRTDDNGKIYQRRNPETERYEGLPNTSYDLNGYHYETDEKGRIVTAGGTLKVKAHKGRPTLNDEIGGKEVNDEKGHLIGDQFEGSNLSGNLVAMGVNVNRSEYRKMEERLSKAVGDGKNVNISIDVKYDGDSMRPNSFSVKYTIDGETFKETFKN